MDNHDSSVKIDDIVMNAIYGYYVKYDKLIELINKEYAGSNATTLNLFIDVNNILCKVEELSARFNVHPSDGIVLMAGIINMAAHYREFFRSRYGCMTRIYLINSLANAISPLYDKSFSHARNHPKNCKLDYELMNMTCNFIPGVAYYECSVEFSTMVSFIIGSENNLFPSLAITKDNFAFQLAGHQNVKVLRPSKYKGVEHSFIVNEDNLIQKYCDSINNPKVVDKFPACLIGVLMAMTRIPSRGVSSIYQVPKALDLLTTGLNNNPILQKYPWDPLFYFTQLSAANNNRMDKDIPFLVNRFKAAEVVYFHLLGYKEMPESLLFNGIVDLYDPKGMWQLNETYFKDHPLDLQVL